MDQYGNMGMNDWLGIAQTFSKIGKQAKDEQLAAELRPHQVAYVDARAKNEQIALKTKELEAQREEAGEAYTKWKTLQQNGHQDLAEEHGLKFFNDKVYDGRLAGRAADKTPGMSGYILVDRDGKEEHWDPKPEEIDQAWRAYIAPDKKQFFEGRLKEETDRFNLNAARAMDPEVYIGPMGETVFGAAKVDVRTGKLLPWKGVGAGDNKEYSQEELQKLGYRHAGTLDKMADGKWIAEQRSIDTLNLTERLKASKNALATEKDPGKRATLLAEHGKGIDRLRFLEELGGATNTLSEKEMMAVESRLASEWKSLGEEGRLMYGSEEAFAGKRRTAMHQMLLNEKQKGRMSNILAVGGDTAAPSGGKGGGGAARGNPVRREGWKAYDIPDKAAPAEAKKGEQPRSVMGDVLQYLTGKSRGEAQESPGSGSRGASGSWGDPEKKKKPSLRDLSMTR